MEYCSTIKKKEILQFTTSVDHKGIMLSEISQTERQIPYNSTRVCNINKTKQNKTKQTQQNRTKLIDMENRLVASREEGHCEMGKMGKRGQLYGDGR